MDSTVYEWLPCKKRATTVHYKESNKIVYVSFSRLEHAKKVERSNRSSAIVISLLVLRPVDSKETPTIDDFPSSFFKAFLVG